MKKTVPVRSYEPNAWGLYDMHGNVGEWRSDWNNDYPTEPVVDPIAPVCTNLRMIRGGAWGDVAEYCRSACRNFDDPAMRYDNLGFRVVLGCATR